MIGLCFSGARRDPTGDRAANSLGGVPADPTSERHGSPVCVHRAGGVSGAPAAAVKRKVGDLEGPVNPAAKGFALSTGTVLPNSHSGPAPARP
jgi:hypothetical protein